MDKKEIQGMFRMQPTEALRYLDNKGLNIKTDAMLPREHAYAFGFANLTRLDIAQDLVNGLRESIANGDTADMFIKKMTPILKKKGWWGTEEVINTNTGEITRRQMGSSRRLKTIFYTQSQQAFMAARYEQLVDSSQRYPYWRYRAVMDLNTRPSHAKLNNLIFHHSDPIWDIIFPPNGFNCRCRVEFISLDQITRDGLVISRTENILEEKVISGLNDDGSVIEAPVRGVEFKNASNELVTFYPDVGFDINPGRQVWKSNLDKYDFEISRPYVRAGLEGPELDNLFTQLKENGPTGEMLPAAIFSPAQQAKLNLPSRTVYLSDIQLLRQGELGLVPELVHWPWVQTVIEQPTVITSLNQWLRFYRQDINGQWWQVVLDKQGGIILSFLPLSDNSLALALTSGLLIEDNRL